jgi:hypothetical protein
MAENAVPQKYVGEKQRRNLIAVSCEFGFPLFHSYAIFPSTH